jgi:Zn ribbon nucleic-acid-binding protein
MVREICVECGYTDEEADRVASLVRKEDLKGDEECQVLEDVACLVFLDDQFEEFEKAYDEEKIVGILKKTWAKMSDRGHELALGISVSERVKALITKALST